MGRGEWHAIEGSGDGLVIRRCRAEDVSVIERREPAGRGYASATFARQADGRCIYLVAWLHDEPVGSAELEWAAPPELKNLTVASAFRGRGIGTALIRAAEPLAVHAGAIRIGVAEDNRDALRLYSRLGYRSTGETVTYSYAYVDDDGLTGAANETSDLLEKTLTARP